MPNPLGSRYTVRLHSIYTLAEGGHLNAAGLQRALQLAGLAPTASQAWKIADRGLLIFGVALMLLGIVFAVAYNWEWITAILGSWGKFAAMQLLIFAAFGFAWFRGLDTILGRIALIAAIVLIGPLLALFGQTYQTGADTFTLFLTWAGLALPWVLASRNAAAWLMWLVIVQTALIAFVFSHFGWFGVLLGWFAGWQAVVLSNIGMLVLWELAALQFGWMHPQASLSAKVAPRLIAWVLMAMLTSVTCAWIIFASKPSEFRGLGSGPLLWLLAMGLGYAVYRPRKDLFMLAGGLISLLAVVLVAVGKGFHSTSGFDLGLVFFLLMAVVVFFYTSWARRWLKRVQEAAA